MSFGESPGGGGSGSPAGGGRSPFRVVYVVQLVVGVLVVCGGLIAVRAYEYLLAGGWYVPVMLLFLVVMTVGAGLVSRGATGVWDWLRG